MAPVTGGPLPVDPQRYPQSETVGRFRVADEDFVADKATLP
jgi:hypothetical protein